MSSDPNFQSSYVKHSKMMHKKSVVRIHKMIEWSLFPNIKQENLDSDQRVYDKNLHRFEQK